MVTFLAVNGRAFAEGGYDLTIGHPPHVQQGMELVDGIPILYSLGNFAFGSKGYFTNEFPGYGCVARTLLEEEGLVEIELTCILTNNAARKRSSLSFSVSSTVL